MESFAWQARFHSSDASTKLPEEVDFQQFEDLRRLDSVTILDVRQPQELQEVQKCWVEICQEVGHHFAFDSRSDRFRAR